MPVKKKWYIQKYKQDIKRGVCAGSMVKRRKRIFKRDGNQCLLCYTSRNLTLDHIIPSSKGGSNQDSNLQTLCRKCHNHKEKQQVLLFKPFGHLNISEFPK